MNVAFLLGAGVSQPAEMPTTKSLTQTILSGETVFRELDGLYRFGSIRPPYRDEYVPRITGLLRVLQEEIKRNFDDSRPVNYEDLYYVASQIHDDGTGAFANPVVLSFVNSIWPKVEAFAKREPTDKHPQWDCHNLATEAVKYIADIVWRSLSKKPCRLDHLNLLTEASQDGTLSSLSKYPIYATCFSRGNLE